MSTNRSKDRSSLCSFTFADGRQCAVSSRACLAQSGAARDLLFAVVVAGLQTRQRDGREHPVSSRVQRSQIPTLSEGTCFSPCSHASPSPCRRGRGRGYRLSPFRQLCVRLRSQLRPRTPLPWATAERSSKTQNRLHPRLSRPNPRANPAPRPARIHQRLRHKFLARNHPHLP